MGSTAGVDASKVTECMIRSKDDKLKNELEHPAWSPHALRINGWRYTGMMDADLVTRAICAGFITQPQECADLMKPRDPTKEFEELVAKGKGISFTTFFAGIFGLIFLTFIAFFC